MANLLTVFGLVADLIGFLFLALELALSWRHARRHLLQTIDDQQIGDVNRLTAQFWLQQGDRTAVKFHPDNTYVGRRAWFLTLGVGVILLGFSLQIVGALLNL
jgi:hypothetical protein